ncbi:site-specific integrase [Sphingomonas sp.]|uniref:tyrosine-type recombinase/integrase n=1 Tax=Sphingomonas sp. TaxID=28214 RepID=UPI001EC6571B|nr:site-specific integrase [Sphingomonas sp.]MBX3593783.1 integrase arm-type DNA-binding domain-containing protein [Sphingomonas sp.]
MSGLTALEVKNAKPGRHADGHGLYLLVRPSGSRSWVLRTQVDGRRQDLGLGPVSQLSLAQARAKASELRNKVKAGENVRAKEEPSSARVPTFERAARDCHAAIKGGWANKRHSDSWLSSLENHIFPAFGKRPVDQVTSVMVRDALSPIWLSIPETARRILQRIGTVLDYSHIEGWCPHEAALRSVTKGLPRQPTEEGHFAAMPYAEVPALVRCLNDLPETAGRDALLFTLFNAVRSGETRLAVWPEFDLTARIWSIPAARMKMKKPHVVPLSSAALAILERRWRIRTDDEGLVFSTDGKRPLSDMTMTKVLRDLRHAKVTVHGFRSSFTDWAAEKTRTPKEIVDKALAHKVVDRVEAAYRRTDFLERRRRLMVAWSKFLAEI